MLPQKENQEWSPVDKYRSHPTPVFKKLADVITGEHVHVSVMQYQHLKGPIQKNCTVESEYNEGPREWQTMFAI